MTKNDLIHHGIPDIPFVDPNDFKEEFGVSGRTVLFTFGLLSPNKGIEHVLNALPRIVAEFPNVVYIVLGATHPHSPDFRTPKTRSPSPSADNIVPTRSSCALCSTGWSSMCRE